MHKTSAKIAKKAQNVREIALKLQTDVSYDVIHVKKCPPIFGFQVLNQVSVLQTGWCLVRGDKKFQRALWKTHKNQSL